MSAHINWAQMVSAGNRLGEHEKKGLVRQVLQTSDTSAIERGLPLSAKPPVGRLEWLPAQAVYLVNRRINIVS
jgi:hypothetical protein